MVRIEGSSRKENRSKPRAESWSRVTVAFLSFRQCCSITAVFLGGQSGLSVLFPRGHVAANFHPSRFLVIWPVSNFGGY